MWTAVTIQFTEMQLIGLDDGDHDTVRFDGEFEQFKLSVKADESGRRYIEVKDLLQGDLASY